MNSKELTQALRLARLEIGAFEMGKPPTKRPGLQALAELWETPEFGASRLFIESCQQSVEHSKAIIQGSGRKIAQETWPQSEVFNKRRAIEAFAHGTDGNREMILLCKWFFDDMEASMENWKKAEAFLATQAAKQVERMARARR